MSFAISRSPTGKRHNRLRSGGFVRVNAVSSLSRLGGARARSALRARAGDSVGYVRGVGEAAAERMRQAGALVTTEVGLAVAIPALIFGNLLSGWAESIKDAMEKAALHVMNQYKDKPQPELEGV